ncbi:hypothetical protein [Spongiimicrobium salis]|uniref:hypothetical protein n=1 Tax=Spongiimicrobium salis TaxID=1667022 RepID=UPI00374D1CE2
MDNLNKNNYFTYKGMHIGKIAPNSLNPDIKDVFISDKVIFRHLGAEIIKEVFTDEIRNIKYGEKVVINVFGCAFLRENICFSAHEITSPGLKISMNFSYNNKNWEIPISTLDFMDSLSHELRLGKTSLIIDRIWKTKSHDHFTLSLNLDLKSKFSHAILLSEKQIRNLFSASFIRSFNIKLNEDIINFPFEIDEQFHPAYKQYLIYFSQFLKDLGIQAKSAIIDTDDKGFILSVTPHDKHESLKNVFEALKIYLKIPDSKDLNSIDTVGADNAVVDVVLIARNFKELLAVAQDRIQEKDHLINQKDHMIMSLQEKVNKNIINLETDKKEDVEPILPGVEAGTLKLWGFHFKLQDIFRLLKRNR